MTPVAVDHLVVAAATLAQGAAWCEAVLGAVPSAGGRHATMGTHNRLLRLGSAAQPRVYLEIIAVDPDAPAPPHPRWFGLDALQPRLASEGPRLIHAVARTGTLQAHRDALVAAGHAPGDPTAFERGDYRWQLLVRGDGALELGGALPTLLQWQGPHPADALPDAGVALASLELRGLPEATRAALGLGGGPAAARPDGMLRAVDGAGPALSARLRTPRGDVLLESETR